MLLMDSDVLFMGLVEKAQAGDRKAFDTIVEGCRARLEALIESRFGKHLRDRAQTEDILQETLLRAFRSLSRFRWQGDESFLRWLGGIAEHVILDLARKRSPGGDGPPAKEIPAPSLSQSTVLRREERFDRLEKALEGLSPEHRQVILLSRIKGIPIKEIAKRMDRSPDAVTQLLLRALRKLRESFGDTESFHLPKRSLD